MTDPTTQNGTSGADIIATGNSGLIIGVDTGGTFTDVTMLDPQTGRIWTAKTPSTPDDPSRGFGNGIADILKIADMAGENVNRVLHGTTVATNLILEEKGPPTAMIVTEGFRYMVEIGRQDVPRGKYLFSWIKPKRPVRPQNIHEVAGRIDPHGNEIEPLDEEAVRNAARQIAAAGIRAISIVLLNSYAGSTHERRAGEIVREEYPDAHITISSDIVPLFREYERSMTANLNAYVMETVSTYVARLEDRIGEKAINAPLLLMKSSGGVASARAIRQRPVETALSGPAAGIVGATFIGASVGMDNLIGVDIGGTSADISLIYRGQPGLTEKGRIGDWPIALPMVDLTTIGAGGGSIARVNSTGVLTVGPESAGAMPGPVCYRRGGTEPTITDAHLVLGHLPPYLLDGSFELDVAGAREAIETHVARKLGMTVERAAQGILDIADNAMVGTIRVVSIERGYDPREFVLVPFGGAGPIHGGSLARLMGIRTTLLAPTPGVLSALGLLVSNLKAEFSQTSLQQSGKWDVRKLAETFTRLESDALNWFEAEAVPDGSRIVQRVASMRYQNQGFELSVPFESSVVDEASLDRLVEAFHVMHERLYTFAQRDTPVELANVRVDAIGTFPPPPIASAPSSGSAADAQTGTTRAYVEDGWVDAPIYDRAKLGVGAVVHGPAIITQLDTTSWLLPGQRGEVHPLGSIIVTDDRI
ncbi:MAG: hydantoinase/oxoprolinase family protein [Sphingobium sp.]